MTTDPDPYMARHFEMRRMREEMKSSIWALLAKFEKKYSSAADLRLLAEVFDGAYQKVLSDALAKERAERATRPAPAKVQTPATRKTR